MRLLGLDDGDLERGPPPLQARRHGAAGGTATLVPLFTDDIEHGRKGDATSAIISFALVALVGVTLLAAAISPLLIMLLSTGSPGAKRADYVSAGIPLALLFAPQVFFYGLMAVWSAVLNARHRFLAAAWAPVGCRSYNRTTNSSPPERAMKSPLRVSTFRRKATWMSALSPSS